MNIYSCCKFRKSANISTFLFNTDNNLRAEVEKPHSTTAEKYAKIGGQLPIIKKIFLLISNRNLKRKKIRGSFSIKYFCIPQSSSLLFLK